MQKIAEFNLQPYGTRGSSISVPKVFASDNQLEPGEKISIYRGQVNGMDALLLIPVKNENSPAAIAAEITIST